MTYSFSYGPGRGDYPAVAPDATVVLEVTGRFGKSGTLQMHVREFEDQQKPLDLDAVTPRAPSFPFGINRVRWTDSSGKEIKLSAKTWLPLKK